MTTERGKPQFVRYLLTWMWRAFDPHPQQLDKGKERGPRSLPLEDRECDDLSPDVYDSTGIPSLRPRIVPRSIRWGPRHANFRSRRDDTRSLTSQNPSRARSHMDTATGQELAGTLQAEVCDEIVAVQEAPATTPTIAPQQVEINDLSPDVDDSPSIPSIPNRPSIDSPRMVTIH
ncbi:hypothetical protein DTO006G1_5246 [Penicillium roqueforti]|uniref:uncharacterized protein n=1 Tax=Penicillium roqueforti TaxID=5082 RepID=UPI00190A6D3D|nr:uncharacterized protein LCP9604111_3433 [Penicillium roqueforti]KAF9250531.1 hypothetical protein LCP9604111_3433 [Penicillium roqueforti]KAI1833215.1 hypothetical protein CBS147337_6172 [Penicillium roqueforti]KAI2672689.1 hypothetical protein CBS147355_8016 [Penicillium roqueforti]KAI2678997.1 hypothetical protein LCP963914a_7576 [Penicillium roqueforti]KAI2698870.1 hypothetical protein CBS147372_6717 [Penicillium roqueforti]